MMSYQQKKRWLSGLFLIFCVVSSFSDGYSDGKVHVFQKAELEQLIAPHLPAHRETSSGKKVLIIGFDGFTYRFLDPGIQNGELPNFRKITDDGTRIILRSTDFPSSAVAWPVISTGCKPQHLGIHSFFQLNSKTYQFELVNANYRERKAMWEILSDLGKRSIVINVPITYPPDIIDGVMIPGLLSLESGDYTVPPSISEPLRQMGYRIEYQSFKSKISLGETAFSDHSMEYDLNDMFDMEFNRYTLSRYLLDKIDWDFAMIVFTLPDRIQHNAHSLGQEMIRHTYRQMDSVLGGLMARLPPETSLIVLSDHGFRPFSRVFYLIPWLVSEGFIVLGSDGQPDWSKSMLIPIDRIGCSATLRWNVKGRESMGVLDPKDTLEESCNFISLKKALNKLTDSDGKPMLDKLQILETEGSGPELLITFKSDCLVKNDLVPVTQFLEPLNPPIFDHEHDGICILYQEGVIQAKKKLNASVLDVAPTALYLMGVPIPDELDGLVLLESVEEGYAKANPVNHRSIPLTRTNVTSSPLTDSALLEQLKSLGYIGDSAKTSSNNEK